MEKDLIKQRICYTDLVFERVNKKLKTKMTRNEIELMILEILSDTSTQFEKIGKNFYLSNTSKKIKLVVNASTYRLITVDKI